MLSLEIMKQIKQSNVSKDAKKTKIRIKEEFSAAPRDVKNTIITQTTQNRNTIYRAGNTGNASGRIILAMAEGLNISPFYFTGAIDEKEPCTDEAVKKFLLEYGYKKLVPTSKRPAKSTKPAAQKKAAEPEAAAEPELTNDVADNAQSSVFRITINDSEKMRSMVENLDLASATQLLEALFIRAKAGGNAEQLCDVVKHCLLA